MKSSSVSKSFSKILMTILCLSLLSPAVRASDRKSTSRPPGEGSAPTREHDSVKPLLDSSKKVSPQSLSAEEVQEISARSEEPGPQVAGGALSNLHLTYIVIALAAAVLVLVLK
jgi:hypothetical protein